MYHQMYNKFFQMLSQSTNSILKMSIFHKYHFFFVILKLEIVFGIPELNDEKQKQTIQQELITVILN